MTEQETNVIGTRPVTPVLERIKALSVVSPDGCIIWQGSKAGGYGRIRTRKGLEAVHRVMYSETKGKIPDGMVVKHLCHNKLCCNQEHLEVGTHKENVQDSVPYKKKTTPRGKGYHKQWVGLSDKELVEQILSLCDYDENGCANWTRSVSSVGYGVITLEHSKTKYTHRLVYECSHGEIPDGLVVRHACDNRKCCNLEHLSIGTYADNALDTSKAGNNRVLSDVNVKEIRILNQQGVPKKQLARDYKVSPQTIRNVIARKVYAWL